MSISSGIPSSSLPGEVSAYNFNALQPDKEPELFTMFGTTFRGSQVIRTPAAEDAKPHFKRSLIAAALAPPLVLLPFLPDNLTVLGALLLVIPSSYAGWAIYWGFVGIGNLLLEDRKLSAASEGAIHGLAESFGEHPYALALIVVLYSICGGGIHEFRKYRGIAANPTLDSE
jgi:hypothetical protein